MKKGFTLIEIIIVIIILSVLATIAVPALFAQIKRNQGQEAIHTMNYIRSAMEACGISNNNIFDTCTTWDSINMSDPSYSAGNSSSKFNYTVDAGSNLDGPAGSYVITARSLGNPDGDVIQEVRNVDGSLSCQASGIYAEIC